MEELKDLKRMKKAELIELLERRQANEEQRGKMRYVVVHEGAADHQHSYEDYDLLKSSGIVFCHWKCECGREISELVGEAGNPIWEGEDLSEVPLKLAFNEKERT